MVLEFLLLTIETPWKSLHLWIAALFHSHVAVLLSYICPCQLSGSKSQFRSDYLQQAFLVLVAVWQNDQPEHFVAFRLFRLLLKIQYFLYEVISVTSHDRATQFPSFLDN